MAMGPLLEAIDQRIGVGEVIRHRVWRFMMDAYRRAGSVRSLARGVGLPLTDEPEREIDVREGGACGHDPRTLMIACESSSVIRWESFAEQGREPPRRRRAPAVEDARGGEDERRRARAGDPRAAS